MTAIIKPIGMLKEYTGGAGEVPVETGQTVREALRICKIPSELVAMVMINEQLRDKDVVLQEGDVVKVMAVIGGG